MFLKKIIFFVSFYISFFCFYNTNAENRNLEKLKLKAEEITFTNNNIGEREIAAAGNVEVEYTNYRLCSNTLIFNEKQDLIKAKGDVFFKEKNTGGVVSSQMLFSNKALTEIKIENFDFTQAKIFGSGVSASKNNNIFTFNNFIVSSCQNDKKNDSTPIWQMKAKKAIYNSQNQEIKLSNIIFYIKGIQAMWIPFYTIKTKQNYGFKDFSFTTSSSDVNIKTPYFIKDNNGYHYFLFTPNLFYHKTEESKIRTNNYRVEYSYKKNNNNFNLDYTIAPNSYYRDDKTGAIQYKEKDRYQLNVNFEKTKDNGSFGFNYNNLSDRFFLQDYKEQYDNYLVNNVFINHAFKNQNNFIHLETVKFVPIVNQFIDNSTRINLSGSYQQYWLNKSLIEFYINPDIISTSGDDNIDQSRFSNSFGLNYQFKNSTLKSYFNVDARFDLYNTNYSKVDQSDKSEYVGRFIPSLSLKNEVPLYFKSQDKTYLVKIAPELNFKLAAENTNSDKIFNQDSSITYVNSSNILSTNNFYGYDTTQEGLTASYGLKFNITNIPNNIKLNFLIGQKASKLISKNQGFNYSSYVFTSELLIQDKLTLKTDLTISKNNKIEYANSEINFTIWDFNFGFLNSFIAKEINNSLEDIKSNTYKVNFQIPNSNFALNVRLVENLNFKIRENVYKRKIVESDFNITLNKDCLFFMIGAINKSYSILNKDVIEYYFSLKLRY